MNNKKQCTKCLEIKSLEDFPFRNRSKGYKSSSCKECKNKYLNEYYASSFSRRDSIKYDSSKKIRISENIKKIEEYLLTHPCVDCGEKDIVVKINKK